jgi:hypothetical protein
LQKLIRDLIGPIRSEWDNQPMQVNGCCSLSVSVSVYGERRTRHCGQSGADSSTEFQDVMWPGEKRAIDEFINS